MPVLPRAPLLLLTLALACAGGRAGSGSIAADALLAGGPLVHPEPVAMALAEPDVLAVTPEMEAFLAAHVDSGGTAELRLRQLVAAIIDSRTFGVEYDERTRTASETFRIRRGNCLSFSTLFVAMARHVGLSAEYQEVDVPPDWTLDKDTYVLNRHVNVFVDLDASGTRVVDFNIGDFKTSYDMRRISDARARAHYYNNVGVERMQGGDTASALACFRRALEGSARGFAPAWTNLGTLYLRSGDPAFAEAAYLNALQAEPGDLVAMSNLVRLYDRLGDRQRADAYRKRVVYHRKLNPYYRYELARRAYASQKYGEAIVHLEYASRKRPREDEFFFLLGLSYLQAGDARAARRWLARAEEVAATDALKKKYSNKIEILLRESHRTDR